MLMSHGAVSSEGSETSALCCHWAGCAGVYRLGGSNPGILKHCEDDGLDSGH